MRRFLLCSIAALAIATVPMARAATYFIAPATASPAGSDSNAGTSSSVPWLTPNHALNCGDIILATAGTYNGANFSQSHWGTVTCPANNNVAWLKCAVFDTCKFNSTTDFTGIWVDKSYWGVQGWEGSVGGSAIETSCFQASPNTVTLANIHHIIFANNVANGCEAAAFGAFNQNTTASVDYLVIVGNIAYNGAQGTNQCGSGISVYQPRASDTVPGTHIYIAGNFSYGNFDPATCASGPSTDGEGFIIDTPDFSQGGGTAYTQQIVVDNNIAVDNGSFGFQVFNNQSGTTKAPVYFRHNTSWGNLQDPNQSKIGAGEITLVVTSSTTVTGNIAQATAATGLGGHTLYGMAISGGDATDSIAGNFATGFGGSNNTFLFSSGGFAYGSNVLGTSPSFVAPANPSAPSCGAFASVPACMASVIANFSATASGAAAYGYQNPSTTSIADALYPVWLCNVAALPSGLVTPGCGVNSVAQQYFGQDINSTSTAWPNITQALNPSAPFGVLRLHDNGADLMDIFGNTPTATCNTTTHIYTGCNWTAFDHWLSQAAAHSQVVMYTFHKTPNFAGSFTSSPPDDADDKAMTDAIRDRGGCTVATQTGCIRFWEVWNEPNNDGGTLSTTSSGIPYWSGSLENLVHHARNVRDEVKTPANGGVNGVDPNAMVVGPGAAGFGTYTNLPGGNITVSGACNDSTWNTNLNSPEAFICEYLRRTGSGAGDSTGAAYTDAMTIHIYPNASVIGTIAEFNMNLRMTNFAKVFSDLGINLCPHGVQGKGGGSCTQMFATEDSWGAVSSGTYPRIGPDATNSMQVSGSGLTGSWRDDQSAYLIKEYALGWSLGLDMYVWYGWDFQNGWGNQWCKAANVNIGCDLASSGNASYPYQQKSAWSYGAIQSWMLGTQMSGTCSPDSNTTYSCNFIGPWGYTARLYWNSAQTGVALTPPGFTQKRDMYGTITTFSGTLTPNYYPVLLEHLAPARRYAGGWN